LIDGTASPERTEGYGGSGAYAPRTGIPGMEGGDLDLELDEFGNFSTSTEGPGGQEPPRIPGSSIGSFRPDSVIAPATRSAISNTARSSEATFDRLATNHNGSPTNKDGTPTNSTVTTSIAPNADLATTKTCSTSATPASLVSYTMIATANLDPSPAEAVTITDSIVPGLTGVTASDGGVYEPATGIVPEGPVAIARETVTRTIGFTVPPPLTSIRNTARSTSLTPDSPPPNNNGTNPNATVTPRSMLWPMLSRKKRLRQASTRAARSFIQLLLATTGQVLRPTQSSSYTAMKAKILSTATRIMTVFTEGKIATFSMGVQGMTGCLATGETIL